MSFEMKAERRPRRHERGSPTATDANLGFMEVGGSSGDSSFEDFYEQEHRGLFGALCLISGNRHDAEELMQDAFLKIWERWSFVQGLSSPAGYLYRTAMNGFRMRYRRAKLAARKFPRPVDRSEAMEVFEVHESLDRGLASLSPRQRAAVVLMELLEFSSGEAARCLGITPATVRKLASQGRASLRSSMGGDR